MPPNNNQERKRQSLSENGREKKATTGQFNLEI